MPKNFFHTESSGTVYRPHNTGPAPWAGKNDLCVIPKHPIRIVYGQHWKCEKSFGCEKG